MCILTTQHYACTCTSYTAQWCDANTFSCDTIYNNVNVCYACSSCQNSLYRALQSVATSMSWVGTLTSEVLGPKLQPASSFQSRDGLLHDSAKGSFQLPLGCVNLERTRERREDAEVLQNMSGGTIRPSTVGCLPITRPKSRLREAAFAIQGENFPHPPKYYRWTDITLSLPGSVTLTASSVFADVVAELPCLKRKRSIAWSAETSDELSSLMVRSPPLPHSLPW